MESKMQIFDSAQFGRIRTFDVKGNPWFVGRDVAVALGYKETALEAVEVMRGRVYVRGSIKAYCEAK